jgi:GT2 family glycosyltransferase
VKYTQEIDWKTNMPPSVAAIVLGWNYRTDSADCIRSILSSDCQLLRVWYVDNGSTDGAPEYLHRLFPGITVLPLGENLGLVRGYNAGIDAALTDGSDYVCVFNNDVTIAPGTLPALVAAAVSQPRIGLCVPKIVLHADGQIIWSAGARRRRFPPGIVQRGLGQPASDRRFDRPLRVEYATSCMWLMSVPMVRHIGLFDPAYSFYYSDYEYCRRATRNDWQILYVPRAVVAHKVSLSTQNAPKPARWWHNIGEAEGRFYRQYEGYLPFAVHVIWILARTAVQGNARYIPAYMRGIAQGLNAARI